jgi:hypothetical protein
MLTAVRVFCFTVLLLALTFRAGAEDFTNVIHVSAEPVFPGVDWERDTNGLSPETVRGVDAFTHTLDTTGLMVERLPELPEDGLELMQAKAEAGGQLKEVGGSFPGQLHLPVQLPLQPENLPAMGVADLAFRRQLEMLRIPDGEPDAEFVLQGPEQLAGIGRGAAVLLGCPGKASGFDYIAEHPQSSHLHD